MLVDSDTDQGIRRPVLPPGRYRINPYGYKVDAVPAVEVKPGFVGVRRRLLGKDGPGRFALKDDEKGILRDVLQPGTYYLNPKEYEVIPCEVGIYQTTYHYNQEPGQEYRDHLRSAEDGNVINMDCTIEWEVEPTSIPDLVAEFGNRWRTLNTTSSISRRERRSAATAVSTTAPSRTFWRAKSARGSRTTSPRNWRRPARSSTSRCGRRSSATS